MGFGESLESVKPQAPEDKDNAPEDDGVDMTPDEIREIIDNDPERFKKMIKECTNCEYPGAALFCSKCGTQFTEHSPIMSKANLKGIKERWEMDHSN